MWTAQELQLMTLLACHPISLATVQPAALICKFPAAAVAAAVAAAAAAACLAHDSTELAWPVCSQHWQ
jgi:hypothetical protein